MSPEEIVAVWKDPERRQQAGTAHPAGEILLDNGGGGTTTYTMYVSTMGCCITDDSADCTALMTTPCMSYGCCT